LYLPNAEITLDLEVNEVEVKVLTSLASVVGITAIHLAKELPTRSFIFSNPSYYDCEALK
jgi:hypothetical protein